MKGKEGKFIVQMTAEDLELMIEKTIEKQLEKWEKTGNIKEYSSYREAAKLLDIKPATVAERVRKGFYTKYINGGKLYVKNSEIMRNFIELS